MKYLHSLPRDFVLFIEALYGFWKHLLLPLLLLGLGAMVVGKVGQSYGIPYLFWDQIWYRQLIVGIVLGLAFAHMIFLGFLLDRGEWHARKLQGRTAGETHWSESALIDRDRQRILLPGLNRTSTLFLWYYLWFLALTMLLVVLSHHSLESLIMDDANLITWPLVSGFLFTVTIGVYVLACVGQRLAEWLGSEEDEALHFWAGFVFVVFILVYVTVYFFRGLPASISVIVLFSLIGGIYGFVSYGITAWKLRCPVSILGIRRFRLPTVRPELSPLVPPGGLLVAIGVLIALWIGGNQRYRYRFPLLADGYAEPAALASLSSGGEVRETDAARLPLLQPTDIALTETRQRRPFVIVSTSGGGITAAAWTVAVLGLLEDGETGLDEFPHAIRAITGASGGMVGAAYWNATLEPPGSPHGYHNVPAPELYRRVTEDSLTAMTHQLVFNDLGKSFFSPWPVARDRGQVLESTWKEATRGAMGATFGDLYDGEKEGWRPSIVFSPMLVEDGRRLLISNLDLGGALLNRAAGTGIPRSLSGVQFRRLFPAEGPELQLSTAARMNASFPYVSPAASLPTTPKRRVVDAGYYDNYGIDVAANWLMRCWDRGDLLAQTRHVIIIEIDAFSRASLTALDRPDRKAESEGPARALEGVSGPPSALLSAWDSSQSFCNDELIAALRDYLHGSGSEAEIELTTARFTNKAKVSLSWTLTENEKRHIREAASPDLLPELSDVQRVWKDYGAAKTAPTPSQ